MAKRNAPVVDVFEGYVRHTCGWVNVKGGSFVVGAGCPRCGERITAVEKLSEAEVKELGLKKLSGAALDRAARKQKGGFGLPQELEEEDDEDDDDGDDEDGDDDDPDGDGGNEGDDDDPEAK